VGFQTVHIETNGNQKYISLPIDFQIDGDKFYLKRLGDLIYLIPYKQPWKSMWDSLDMFSEDFLSDRNQGTAQRREDI